MGCTTQSSLSRSLPPAGDGVYHANDTSGNGTRYDPEDRQRVLYNNDYNGTQADFAPFNTTVTQAFDQNATSITVANAAGLTPQGVVRIMRSDNTFEYVHYSSVVGNTLGGLTRAFRVSTVMDHDVDESVTIEASREDFRDILYGAGTRGLAVIR